MELHQVGLFTGPRSRATYLSWRRCWSSVRTRLPASARVPEGTACRRQPRSAAPLPPFLSARAAMLSNACTLPMSSPGAGCALLPPVRPGGRPSTRLQRRVTSQLLRLCSNTSTMLPPPRLNKAATATGPRPCTGLPPTATQISWHGSSRWVQTPRPRIVPAASPFTMPLGAVTWLWLWRSWQPARPPPSRILQASRRCTPLLRWGTAA
mmetsp:Transcript_10599/g.33373  ORF Transcript_10599/g.33373 Transcript_10599/m.33373 type:complete len:209 (+) Transcript_10599:485-1111(+)